MSIEQINGLSINVVRRGQGDDPILYLHCSLARHDAFVPLMQPFETDHEITFFDLPGHGRSQDLEEGCDVQTITRDIALELLQDGAHVVGHSFGATVALRMAVEGAPIRGLTLVEPVLFAVARGTEGYDLHERDFAPMREALATNQRADAARTFLNLWGAGVEWRHLPKRAKDEALRSIHSISDAEPALHHDIHDVLRPGGLEAVDIPVTLIQGRGSHQIISDIHAGLAARLPNARCVTLDGGHMVPLTNPAAVAAEIARDLG